MCVCKIHCLQGTIQAIAVAHECGYNMGKLPGATSVGAGGDVAWAAARVYDVEEGSGPEY